MITNGFTYIAVLIFIAAMLVWLQRYTKSKFFDYAPPIDNFVYNVTIDHRIWQYFFIRKG